MSSIAYLGPQGTHSETVARQIYPKIVIPSASETVKAEAQSVANDRSKMKGIPCLSIPDVFRKVVNGEAEAGLVPFENLLHGAVAETFDQLCHNRGKVVIRSSHIAEIRQALGAIPIKGESPEQRVARITEIRSHSQAIGQCSIYLNKVFPHAVQISTASTSGAAAEVAALKLTNVGVIAPADTLKQCGFEIVESDVSDTAENKTRFVLISKPDMIPNLDEYYKIGGSEAPGKQGPQVTSLMVDPGRDRKGLLIELLEIISEKHHLNLIVINSRPDLRGGFVFHFDLEGSIASKEVADCLTDLNIYCSRVTGSTAALTVIGSYNRTTFSEPAISTVAVIGANGVMGRWFTAFFSKVGISVRGFDVDSKVSLKETISGCDAVVVSVPMSVAPQVIDELKPLLIPGQLVVENCSIKSCALPLLSNLSSDIEVLGIHTMFSGAGLGGATIGTERGQFESTIDGHTEYGSRERAARLEANSWAPLRQNIVVTKTKSSGNKAQAFEDLLYKHGATISHSSIEKHDKAVAAVQSIVQLILIATGEALSQSFSDKETLDVFATPNSRSMMQALKRVLSQPDTLIEDLQTLNPHAEAARHLLVEILFGINAALDHGDSSRLSVAIERGRKLLL